VLVSALLLGACATWQQTAKVSLDAAGAAAEGAKTIGDAHWATKCEASAKTCGCSPLPAPCPCPQLVQCQKERRDFHTALLSLHGVRVLGYTAIASCNESGSRDVLTKLKELAAAVAQALEAAGVL
jgi:hypothetical protein